MLSGCRCSSDAWLHKHNTSIGIYIHPLLKLCITAAWLVPIWAAQVWPSRGRSPLHWTSWWWVWAEAELGHQPVCAGSGLMRGTRVRHDLEWPGKAAWTEREHTSWGTHSCAHDTTWGNTQAIHLSKALCKIPFIFRVGLSLGVTVDTILTLNLVTEGWLTVKSSTSRSVLFQEPDTKLWSSQASWITVALFSAVNQMVHEK